MNRTTPPPTPAGTKVHVPWKDVHAFAAVCATADDHTLEQARPDEHMRAAIAELFPHLDDAAIDRLWDRARIDAAALAELDAGNVHCWPLCDMDPPGPLSRFRAAFEAELEESVEFELRAAFL